MFAIGLIVGGAIGFMGGLAFASWHVGRALLRGEIIERGERR